LTQNSIGRGAEIFNRHSMATSPNKSANRISKKARQNKKSFISNDVEGGENS
jgi:hypothetical protein